MKKSKINTILKTGFTTLLISSLLLVSAACKVPSESDIIEGILENVDEMNGEITIVTNDGETITIKISTDGEEDEESPEISKLEVGSVVKLDADKVEQVERKQIENRDSNKDPSLAASLSSYALPSLNSYEDVFRFLGVLEDAVAFREKGLTWEHIARELSYTKESMLLRLQDIAEESLKAARDKGVITQEQLEYKFKCFDEQASKWTNKIFACTDTTNDEKPSTTSNINDILPSLNSIEDVFRVLGVLEDAIAFYEEDLTWEHIARELDYTADSMHLRLQDIGEEYLKAARDSGLITQEQLEYKFECFDELAMKWVKEIFGDDI
jgi:hypothetical protein